MNISAIPIAVTISFACTCNAQTAQFVPAAQIPDEVSYTALFMVVGSGGEGHWDHQTRVKWLTDRGFTVGEAMRITAAADRFRAEQSAVERELAQINETYRGSPTGEIAKQQRAKARQRLSDTVASLRAELEPSLGPSGAAKLRRQISEMKAAIKMKAK